MIWTGVAHEETIHTPEESLDAFDAGILPIEIAVRWRGKQAIQACRICSVARDHLVGRADVSQVLRHLAAIFDYHALREQPLGGLVVGAHAEIAHELCPEARIDQMQDRVLDAADVLIDAAVAEPVLSDLSVERSPVVTRVGV